MGMFISGSTFLSLCIKFVDLVPSCLFTVHTIYLCAEIVWLLSKCQWSPSSVSLTWPFCNSNSTITINFSDKEWLNPLWCKPPIRICCHTSKWFGVWTWPLLPKEEGMTRFGNQICQDSAPPIKGFITCHNYLNLTPYLSKSSQPANLHSQKGSRIFSNSHAKAVCWIIPIYLKSWVKGLTWVTIIYSTLFVLSSLLKCSNCVPKSLGLDFHQIDLHYTELIACLSLTPGFIELELPFPCSVASMTPVSLQCLIFNPNNPQKALLPCLQVLHLNYHLNIDLEVLLNMIQSCHSGNMETSDNQTQELHRLELVGEITEQLVKHQCMW